MNNFTGWIKSIASGLAFVALLLLGFISISPDANASGGPAYKSGTIAAKGLVLGDNGKPIWAEFDSEGNVVGEPIGEAVGELENAFVMPAGTYRAFVAAFQEVEQEHSAHRTILYRHQYPGTFELADETSIGAPPLRENTYSVVVRTKEVLYDRSINPLLHESPLDLSRLQDIPDSARAVLLGEDRHIITTADVNIGYMAAFYTPEGGQDDSLGQNSLGGYRPGQGTLWGPVAGAKVQTSLGRQPTYSDETGFYVAPYFIPPCPGFYFDYMTNVYVELRYQHFDPQRPSPFGSWYEYRPGWDYCVGFSEGISPFTLGGAIAKLNLMSIEASMVQPTNRIDFTIDVALLTGQAFMQNESRPGIPVNPDVTGGIPMGDTTQYAYTIPDFAPQETTLLDLDGDGNPDTVERWKDDQDQYWYKVWLGDSDPAEDEPDLKRLADYNPDLFDRGLLKQISKDDLENTDFYVYRVSNGQLVTSRKGLRSNESNPYHGGGAGSDTGSLVNYRMFMRGPASFSYLRPTKFEDWQARTSINEELQGRKADHLRVGEQVKVIMINRATGYIGSAIGTFGENLESGLISFSPEPIIMRPPNLKIKTERTYDIQSGLTAGRQREYLIGFEGSGLTSDKLIAITTEWVDWDGSPLPEDLPGYTGRLAKVVEENVLGPVSGRIANFDIQPGKHIQLVQLPQKDIDNSHYYIHVSGEPTEGNPNFSGSVFDSTGAAGQGALQYRPDHYVPVKTPVYDEDTTWARKMAFQKAVDEGNTSLEEAEPFYHWVYRPEMQFSLFDLEVSKIESKDLEGNVIDIVNSELPVLGTADEKVEIFYSLLGDEFPILESFGPGRELIFATGGQELRAVVQENKSLEFDNLDHLALLESEDFLSFRLYQNGDYENILWEYAFITVSLLPSGTAEDVIEISADDPEAIVHAVVLDGLPLDDPETYTLFWQVEGDGIVTTDFETSNLGSFSTLLRLPPIADATARVVARLGSDESNPGFKTPTYRVVPGKPSSIEVEKDGETGIGGLGEIDIKLTVKDLYGNLVEDGTPVYIKVSDVHVEADEATINGEIMATISGLDRAGIKEMSVEAGDVDILETITVHDVEFAWNIPAQIRAGQTVPVTLNATSSYGDLTGLKVHVTAFRGVLKDKVLTIQNGQAQTTYDTGPYRGNAQLYARVGNTATYHEFYVNESSDDIELSETIIVGDVLSNGSFDVATEDGVIPVGYKVGTNLIVRGTPGETKEVSLGSLAEPAKEPVLNYQMDWVATDGKVIDIFQGIDAESDDITLEFDSPRGFFKSFKFTENSEIRVPLDALLNKPDNIGFGFWFKPTRESTGIIEYRLRSQYLTIDAEKRVVFSIDTTNGSFSVTSEPVELEQWHEVGVAYKDDKVILEIDGKVYEAAATGTLIENTDLEYALRVGGGYQGLMSSFRVNDWDYPSLIEFGDGSDATSVTIGSDGTQSLFIRGTGQLTSQAERFNRRLMRAYAAAQKNSYIKSAFAADLPAFCNQEPPESLLSIEALEYLFEYLEKCYLAQKLEQAKIRIKTGDGFTERLLGIRDFATYKTLSLAVLQARSVVSMVNCVEGFLIGSGDSGVSMLCDFISGFLLWGDLRDFVIHFYYFHFGDEGNFDQATYTLSGLGIITNLLQVGGFFAGVAPGVVMTGADAAVSGVKGAVKVFRRAGKLSKYIEQLTGFLSINVMGAGDMTAMAKALTKVLPIIELTAVFAFYKDDFADLIELLNNTVQTEDGLLNLASYIYGYFEKQDKQSGQTARVDDYSYSLIDLAYAKLIPIRKPIQEVIDLLKRVDEFASHHSIDNAGKKLSRVIEQLEIAKKSKNVEVIEIMYEPETLEAFMVAAELGTEAPQKLRNFMGTLRTISHTELYKMYSEIPLNELPAEVKKGMRKVTNQLDTTKGKELADDSQEYLIALRKSHGAAHEVNANHFFHNKKIGDRKQFELKSVQKERKPIKNRHGDPLPNRIDDSVIKIDGGDYDEYFFDSKAWDPDTVESELKRSLSAHKDKKGIRKPGQLYTDIVDMTVRGKYDVRWGFDYRFKEEDLPKIKNWILKGIEQPSVKKRLLKDLKLVDRGVGEGTWVGFIEDLREGLEDFAMIIPKHGTY